MLLNDISWILYWLHFLAALAQVRPQISKLFVPCCTTP